MQSTRQALNDFFCAAQTKAFKQVAFSIGDRDEALDIVQDAMIKLAQHYSDQPENWPKLFQRIIQNLIRDWYRRHKTRSLFAWFGQAQSNNCEFENDSIDQFPDPRSDQTPEQQADSQKTLLQLFNAIKQLPQKQQQAFLLRAWWEFSVEDAAFAMQCSTGSVKTHYFRANKKLRELVDNLDFISIGAHHGSL